MPDETVEVWRARASGSPLCPEAGKMLNQSLADLWPAIEEAFEYAALVGCDVEQYREEVKSMVESVETTDLR